MNDRNNPTDSYGNAAPLAQFNGNAFTADQAAQHFAAMAFPEPRKARLLDGEWTNSGSKLNDYLGYFRLVGGMRDYVLAFDGKYASWRVYVKPTTVKKGNAS